MKKIFAVSLVLMLAGCATSNQNLPTQPDVDLKKYAGTWYEQARLPNRFQEDCVSHVRADYKINPDETISVTNQCRAMDGGTKKVQGIGKLSGSVDPRNSAILKIRFAPDWTSWLPMVWGDYWIIKLQGDYQYSLVGTPDRKYLWVLSRTQDADDSAVNALLDYAATLGFPVERMTRMDKKTIR